MPHLGKSPLEKDPKREHLESMLDRTRNSVNKLELIQASRFINYCMTPTINREIRLRHRESPNSESKSRFQHNPTSAATLKVAADVAFFICVMKSYPTACKDPWGFLKFQDYHCSHWYIQMILAAVSFYNLFILWLELYFKIYFQYFNI